MMTPKITYIQEQTALVECINTLHQKAPAFICIDTEFTRRTTYWPKLELIQLAIDSDNVIIIDCRAVDSLSPLHALLQDASIQKVFHSSRQDLEGLWHTMGTLPTAIIDLQIVAAFLGCGTSIGLNDYVQQFLNAFVDKAEQDSRWDNRPLRATQLHYAALDVVYLVQLYPVVLEQLKVLERETWITAYCEALTEPCRLIANPSDAWVRLKNQVDSEKSLFFLLYFASLREQLAQERDINRTRIISDKNLVDGCDTLATASKQQLVVETLVFSELYPDCAKAFYLLQKKTQQAYSTVKDWSPYKSKLKRGIQPTLTHQQHQLFLHIKKIITTEAERLAIPPTYLASSSLIEDYVLAPSDTHPLISGWREGLIRAHVLNYTEENSAAEVP